MTSFTTADSIASPMPLGTDSAQRRRWLQVLSHVSPQFGGIASTVPMQAQRTESVSTYSCPILAFCDIEELNHLSNQQRENTRIVRPGAGGGLFDMTMRRTLSDSLRSVDGVHIHGIWEPHCRMTSRVAREQRRPYMISVHGMLEKWALNHKRIRKALYATLIELKNLQNAACLRALNRDEAEDYRRVGLLNPIVIVPNGIDTPQPVPSDLFLEAFPHLQGKRIVMFLGRLHSKKGLRLLIDAWDRIARQHTDSHLVIAGPNLDGYQSVLETQVRELNLQKCVTFTGMLSGNLKWSALSSSSAFVLPSYSEGFSVGILEALAKGIPVIATTGCHFPEISEEGCGWVITPNVSELEAAIDESLKLSPSRILQISEKAKTLVATKFTSTIVGSQLAEVYDWLGGGSRPQGVEVL